MTEPPTPKPRRRRWFALSLRGALIAVLIVGGLLGWKARRANLQRRAVAKIARLRGEVIYDWQWVAGSLNGPSLTFSTAEHPPTPAWLRRVVGDEYFQDLAMVILPEVDEPGESPEDQLAWLEGFGGIKVLQIYDGELNPAGMARLVRMTSLRSLLLVGVSDPAIRDRIGEMVHLEDLGIGLMTGTGSDLAFLARMPRLRSLGLIGEPVSDADLAQIGRLTRLESVSLVVADLTDAKLARLMGLDRLQTLNLMGSSQVTDAGLVGLAALKGLETLALGDTPVSEDGLESLGKLARLTTLQIKLGLICQPVLDDFKASRPGLTLTEPISLLPLIPLPSFSLPTVVAPPPPTIAP